MNKIWDLFGYEIRDGVVAGRFSVVEVVEQTFARIDEVEPQVQAFLHLDRDYAYAQAKRLDALSQDDKEHLLLLGMPIAIKDNMVTEFMPTTAASRILGEFRSPYNATVVDKLIAAGAVIVGKTNLDEFAMGSSTEHSAFHLTNNPWDLSRVPGGSSGGSAAAVAARMVPIALGSDTGGSIRQPAAYCGVVGMKPTYGTVSRYGLIAFASSLDQIGPFTRSLEDTSLVMQVISGHDPHDATSLPAERASMEMRHREWRDLRIGIPNEYFGEGIEPAIRSVIEEALEKLRHLGATLVPVSMPHTEYAISTYYLIAPAEASSNLSRFDGVRYGIRATGDDLLDMYQLTREEGFGAEVKRRILLGTHALSKGYYDAYYLKAQKVRSLIREDFVQAFEKVDVIVTPTTPDLPFISGTRDDDPMKMYLSDIFTVTANLAGIPGISIPVGLAHGLPVGMQWLGPALKDGDLLSVTQAFAKHLNLPQWPLGGNAS